MNKKIEKLHYIVSDIEALLHEVLCREACEAGCKWVQLRMKNADDSRVEDTARKMKTICDEYSASLIINDYVEIAKEIDAAGVHLGKNDMSLIEARKILGEKFIIGGTANTFEDIQLLNEARVDYIGLGPFRFTATKKNLSPVIGIDGYQSIIHLCNKYNINIPIIAVGGITKDDVSQILQTGIYGVAVSSSISEAKDRAIAVKEFLRLW